MAKESYLKNRALGFVYAAKGAFLLLRTESSIQLQFMLAVIVTIAGFYYEISRFEWMIQTLAIALVMGIEGVNTAIEKLSDFVQPKHDPKIGLIKDISAGAVMIAAVAASILGLIIYLPKIF